MKFLIYLLPLILSAALSAVATRFLIPKLKSLKMGQKILDIGPRWHKGKEGTPTLGGLAMIFSAIVTAAVSIPVLMLVCKGEAVLSPGLLTVLGYAVINGLIGITDDRVKLLKKQNEGLTAGQKYLLQLLAASLFLFVMRITDQINTQLKIPFTDIELELGIFYYVIAALLLTGMVNAVNLTDGIDGLASSVTVAVGGFFAVVSHLAGQNDLMFLSGILSGVCIGFLFYNFYPAKVFMGDTGSLFLGGFAVGLAFLCGNPLIIVIVGLVYIIETASVMLQVTFYKLTHKRIFKMAPIHHHFEMCGWSEIKIVTVAFIVTAAMAALSYFGV